VSTTISFPKTLVAFEITNLKPKSHAGVLGIATDCFPMFCRHDLGALNLHPLPV
jgi:hypothetical protein